MPENPKDPSRECRNHTQPPRVYLLRPPLQGLWLQGEANFTCLAVGGDLQAARLSWEVAGKPQSGHKEEEPTEHTNGSWSRSSRLALSRASWAEGTPVTCTLSGPGLQSPVTLAAQREHEALAPSKPAVRILTAPGPLTSAEAASWLLCEVSNFSPLGVLLTWLEGRHEVDPSWSATAHPAAQPGNSSFHTWSVLRVPAFPGRAAATYTCVVRHEASRTLLGTSWSLDTGGESRGLGLPSEPVADAGLGAEGQPQRSRAAGTRLLRVWSARFPALGALDALPAAPPGPAPVHTPRLATLPPRSQDESGDDYSELEDTGRLWLTFVALFLVTLLYSGFVTFIKVGWPRQPAPRMQGSCGNRPGPLSPAGRLPSLHPQPLA
eukprot:bmy_22105T0